MTFQGFIDSGKDLRRVIFRYCPDKGIHQAEIAATMSGENAPVIGSLGIDFTNGIIQETCDFDYAAVRIDFSSRSEYSGFSSRMSIECGHCHGSRCPIFKKHVHHLVVHHIVVACVNATSVGAILECFRE